MVPGETKEATFLDTVAFKWTKNLDKKEEEHHDKEECPASSRCTAGGGCRQAAMTLMHTHTLCFQCSQEVPVRLAVKLLHQTLHDLETKASASHLSLRRLSELLIIESMVVSVCLCVRE